MKNRLLIIYWLLILLISGNAQEPEKILIADGSKSNAGIPVYSKELEDVRSQYLQTNRFSVTSQTLSNQKCVGDFYLTDSAEGFFTTQSYKSTAYLYQACNLSNNQIHQGIIILKPNSGLQAKPEFLAHYGYEFKQDIEIVRIDDLNGNGTDELLILSAQVKGKTSLRLVEFLTKGLVSFGSYEIYNLDITPAKKSKIFAQKVTQGSPKFFEEAYQMTGQGWAKVSFQEISLDKDQTNYFVGGGLAESRLLKHLAFLTFILQIFAFVGLLGLVVYEFFVLDKATEAEKKAKESRKAGETPPIIVDNLPRLDPINCQNCGAGVPLQEVEMICPNCQTKTSAPPDYFDISKKREEINEKIRQSWAYLKRANFLNSNWIRYGLGLLALWLIISGIAIPVLISKGNFEPYQSLFSANKAFQVISKLGVFSNCFWIISLLFGFAIWSPRIKKAFPVIELNEHLGRAENAKCLQCGGAIQYQPNDLATVCGYCGIETYRANLAWNLRNLTNQANKKANFSLLEAKKSVEEAIWEITGTPKIFAFLLILIALLGGVAWFISAAYERLPSGVKDIFDLIGEILSLF